MDSTQKPLSSPPSTVLNIANALSSKPSSENRSSQQRIADLFNKVLSNIQRFTQLMVQDYSDEPKMSVMFGVEYMSQGSLEGGTQKRSLEIAQQQLKKLCEENPQNIEFKKALDEITFACSIEKTWYDISQTRANKRCAKKIVEKIAILQEGEGILLATGYETKKNDGHAIMARIVCTDTTPPKKYTFSIYNEGEGVSFHNTSPDDLYNSRLSWKNVPIDKLTEIFFVRLLNEDIPDTARSIKTFYKLLVTAFGRASNEKIDSKNLTTSQRGGSCSAQSVLAALRDMLSAKEYQALKSQLRHDSLYKIYTKMNFGDQEPLFPLIALELIHKIEKNKDKAGSFSKFSDLDQIKKEMEDKIVTQSALTSENETNPQKQIAAFFKGNSGIVAKMTRDTLKTVIEEIETTPCTKKQFQAIRNKAQEYKIPLGFIKKIFTTSKSNVQFQNIISDQDAIAKLSVNKMLELLRRITSQEITCKHSEFYNIKAQAEKLDIPIPEELEKRFPKLTSTEMITEFTTDNALANYMDLETVIKATRALPASLALTVRYMKLQHLTPEQAITLTLEEMEQCWCAYHYSRFYEVEKQAKRLGIQVSEALKTQFHLSEEQMISLFQSNTDNQIVNYMTLETIEKILPISPNSSLLKTRKKYLEDQSKIIAQYATNPEIAKNMDIDTVEVAIEKYTIEHKKIPMLLLERYRELNKLDSK